jgi:hypothetical protein
MSRESIHDLIKSAIVFIVSILLGFINFDQILVSENPSFFAIFIKNLLILFAFIAIGNTISIIYIKRKESSRPMFSNSSLIFWNTIGFSLLGTIAVGTLYSISQVAVFPILSIVVFSIFGFVIGFEINVEMFLESMETKNTKNKNMLEVFDHSIENNLPFVILAIIILFPIDYYVEKSDLQIAGKIFIGVILLIAIYYFGM